VVEETDEAQLSKEREERGCIPSSKISISVSIGNRSEEELGLLYSGPGMVLCRADTGRGIGARRKEESGVPMQVLDSENVTDMKG
jgi:hypothetical protein